MTKRREEYFKEHPLKVKNIELILGVYHQKKRGDSKEVPYCDVILEKKVRKTFRCNDPLNDNKKYSIREIKSIATGFAIRELIPKEYNVEAIAINARKTARGLGLTNSSDIVNNQRKARKRIFRKESAYISR